VHGAEGIETDVVVAHVETDDELLRVLAVFEERWLDNEGAERLTSEEFYGRYTAGEFDGPFGVAWATFYEAYLHMRGRIERIVPPAAFAAC